MNKVAHSQNHQILNNFIGVHSDINVKQSDRVNIKLPYVKEVHGANKPSLFYTKQVNEKLDQCIIQHQNQNHVHLI